MVMTESEVSVPIIPGQGDGREGLGTTTVFVYGSLKRDQPNHHWLAGATGLGEGQLDGVQLFDLGPFPMAVRPAGEPCSPGCQALQGELYRVDAPTLERLDRLEGSPRLFERHWLPLQDGRCAWVYLGRPAQVRHAPLLAHGLWSGPRHPRWQRSEALR
jgi:gamma-glutamylcyclotransferase (GGCT)/AIG2-like uncharacterized protein YtfP